MLERQIKETNRLACILITSLIGVIGATGVIELLTDPFNIWSLMKVIVMVGTFVASSVVNRIQAAAGLAPTMA